VRTYRGADADAEKTTKKRFYLPNLFGKELINTKHLVLGPLWDTLGPAIEVEALCPPFNIRVGGLRGYFVLQ